MPKLFFDCEYFAYSRVPRQIAFCSDDRSSFFEAEILSPDNKAPEGELFRLFGGPGVDIAVDGHVVRCCGDLAFVLKHLKPWLCLVSGNNEAFMYEKPIEVWVSDIQESFFGYNSLRIQYPIYDIRSVAVINGIGFRSALDRAKEVSLTQAGYSPRSGAYTACFLINKINRYEKKS